MERMTGMDAAFLAMETPAHPMHTLKLFVLEPLAGGTRIDRAELPRRLARHLHRVPEARHRVLEVPLGLHHPHWIEDPDFDLGAHLRHAEVAPPGTSRELDRLVGEIAASPLDRRRPLWELWVIEGLTDGRIAALLKIHHALADGLTVAERLPALLSGAPEPVPSPEAAPWSPDAPPGLVPLVSRALSDRLAGALALPGLVRRTGRGLLDKLRHRDAEPVRSPLPLLDAPTSPLNRSLRAGRSFASATLPLEDVRAVKVAFGVTVHDVVLALAAGALRAFLLEEGALPTRPLIASVPTAEHGGPARAGGNHVSSLFVSLETHREDPVERLRSIHAGASAAKHAHQRFGGDLLEAWAEHLPSRALGWALRGWARSGLSDVVPPPLNAIVSSVPGPSAPLYLPGYRLAAIHSVGPILEGIGVNVTAWSYLDRLHVGVLGCTEHLPEPHRLTGAMAGELSALSERARAGAT